MREKEVTRPPRGEGCKGRGYGSRKPRSRGKEESTELLHPRESFPSAVIERTRDERRERGCCSVSYSAELAWPTGTRGSFSPRLSAVQRTSPGVADFLFPYPPSPPLLPSSRTRPTPPSFDRVSPLGSTRVNKAPRRGAVPRRKGHPDVAPRTKVGGTRAKELSRN